MITGAIHRVVEQHAATRGSLVAVVDTDRAISYRELNYAANAVARHLLSRGFRRGARATICLPRGIDLAVVLLAVLKAGGCYTWIDSERTGAPHGVSFRIATSGSEEQHLHLDLAPILAERIACSPNLPVLTRGSDLACVLEDNGLPAVMVPHSTIAALRARAIPHPTPWVGEAGAFDLWMALMAGTTAIVETSAAAVAAA